MSDISALAHTAVRDGDTAAAAAVHNRSALLASDCGLPDLARTWCHWHARLYFESVPLTGGTARRALEPLVNLARLHVRAGRGEDAYQLLTGLYEAVTTRTDIRIDGLDVPTATLTATDTDHQEVVSWLWSVILADASRALISAGRWQDARTHLDNHHGIGHRLLDGLQVAVIAALTSGDPDAALALLDASTPQDPWEHTVASCLTALSGRTAAVDVMVGHHRLLAPVPELAVFHTRLGLSVLQVAVSTGHPKAPAILTELISRTIATGDGYAIRDLLAHPPCAGLLTPSQAADANTVVQDCALGQRRLPANLQETLDKAMADSALFLLTAMNRRFVSG